MCPSCENVPRACVHVSIANPENEYHVTPAFPVISQRMYVSEVSVCESVQS